MGLLRPTLILPGRARDKFTDAELRFIFLHELAHLKRGDLIIQWLVALLQILHWFIKLLENFNQRHSLPVLVGILEDKDQFKRRFSLIAKFTRGAYGWSLLGVLLIALLSVACLTKSKAAANQPAVSNAEKLSPDMARVALKVVQIDEDDYQAHQSDIDASIQKGDYPSLPDYCCSSLNIVVV